MSEVTTLGGFGPTDATLGGSTWANAPGTAGTSTVTTMLEATAATSTNGVDCYAITIPATGLYLMSGYILITEASDAATSHTLRIVFDYDNGLTDEYAAGTDLDGKSLSSNRSEHFIGLCRKDTTATVAINNTIVGQKTAGVGKYKVAFAITKLF